MCGRMTLTRGELDQVADELEAVLEAPAAWRPRYNVAPTDRHPFVRMHGDRRVLSLGNWGFMAAQGSKRPIINARAETVTRGAFHRAHAHRRCIVPADGFYEWRTTAEGRQPVWFHRADGRLLLLAGLWQDGADGQAPRFLVLTTTPNALVAPIHDRMPVLLSADEARGWLTAPGPGLLHPAPEDVLAATVVSPRVNSVRNDDPGCLAPGQPGGAVAGQLPLFVR